MKEQARSLLSKLMPLPGLLFLALIAVKTACALIFSSGYQDTLFIPFIERFISHGGNPWNFFYQLGEYNKFPYPPLMLYLQSLSVLPLHALFHGAIPAGLYHLCFKLPTFIADIAIFLMLVRMFPGRSREVMFFYFASPIILYASYMHAQLDLVPTAALLGAIFLLQKKRPFFGATMFGAALAIKFHVIAALPLLLIYLLKNGRKRDAALLCVVPAAITLLMLWPYLTSAGFITLVLQNKEQGQMFDLFFMIEPLRIYLAPLALLCIYMHFSLYKKINADLLNSTLGLLFAVFISLVPPMPGWYVWTMPFLCCFFISTYRTDREMLWLYLLLSGTYLTYFLFFQVTPLVSLSVLGTPLALKLADPFLRNVSFTLLEGTLFFTIFALYSYGIRSNTIYKRPAKAFLIGIAGDSGAGKTVLSHDLSALLGTPHTVMLEGDADHKWERSDVHWERSTHLDPRMNYLHRQAAHIAALRSGHRIDRIDYDHTRGRFTAPQQVSPNDYIILAGLHPFYLPKQRKLVDLKIFLDTDEAVRTQWKLLRDRNERGYARAKAKEQLSRRRTDALKYVRPQKEYADLVVRYAFRSRKSGTLSAELILDSNIDLDAVLGSLSGTGTAFVHDLSSDLLTQHVTFENAPSADVLSLMAERHVPNLDELINGEVRWQNGLRGLVQFFILLVISEKMKGDRER